MKMLMFCGWGFPCWLRHIPANAIFVSNSASGGFYRRETPYFVKLFDGYVGICPLQQADQAEKPAISDDGDDGQRIRRIAERIAADEYQVGDGPWRNSPDLIIESEHRSRPVAGGQQQGTLMLCIVAAG